MKLTLVVAATGLILLTVMVIFWPRHPAIAPKINSSLTANTNSPFGDTKIFSTADLPDRDPHFSFTVAVPSIWAAEYVADSKGVNFFESASATSEPSLAQSKVFVQFYQSHDFQPPATSDGTTPQQLTLAGYSALKYSEAGKSNASQPSWYTQPHQVIVIRSSSDQLATFYIFAQSPDLSDRDFQKILSTVNFSSPQPAQAGPGVSLSASDSQSKIL